MAVNFDRDRFYDTLNRSSDKSSGILRQIAEENAHAELAKAQMLANLPGQMVEQYRAGKNDAQKYRSEEQAMAMKEAQNLRDEAQNARFQSEEGRTSQMFPNKLAESNLDLAKAQRLNAMAQKPLPPDMAAKYGMPPGTTVEEWSNIYDPAHKTMMNDKATMAAIDLQKQQASDMRLKNAKDVLGSAIAEYQIAKPGDQPALLAGIKSRANNLGVGDLLQGMLAEGAKNKQIADTQARTGAQTGFALNNATEKSEGERKLQEFNAALSANQKAANLNSSAHKLASYGVEAFDPAAQTLREGIRQDLLRANAQLAAEKVSGFTAHGGSIQALTEETFAQKKAELEQWKAQHPNTDVVMPGVTGALNTAPASPTAPQETEPQTPQNTYLNLTGGASSKKQKQSDFFNGKQPVPQIQVPAATKPTFKPPPAPGIIKASLNTPGVPQAPTAPAAPQQVPGAAPPMDEDLYNQLYQGKISQ